MITPGWVPMAVDRPEGVMSWRFEAYIEDGRVVCGIYDIKGHRKAGPKAFAQAVREEMHVIEALARERGAQELRIGGRWGRHILSDYEPFPDPADPMRRRKVL